MHAYIKEYDRSLFVDDVIRKTKGVVLCGFFCLDSPDTEKEFSVNKLIVCSYTMSTDRQGRIHKLNLLNRREEENRQILTENCLAVF